MKRNVSYSYYGDGRREKNWDLNNFEFLNLFSKSYQRTDSLPIDPETKGDSKNHIHLCDLQVIILVCCIYWYIVVISLHYIRLHPLYTASWKSNTITLMISKSNTAGFEDRIFYNIFNVNSIYFSCNKNW